MLLTRKHRFTCGSLCFAYSKNPDNLFVLGFCYVFLCFALKNWKQIIQAATCLPELFKPPGHPTTSGKPSFAGLIPTKDGTRTDML